VLGLIYYDTSILAVSAVPHLATVLIGIITFGLIIKEGTSY